jgi:DNA modification methylase
MIPTLNHPTGTLQMGDCLDLMKRIPDGSVDMVLCDLPYGTTQNKWDSVIPFEPLWSEYWRICKPNAAVVLTAQSPFDKVLGVSQIQHFKYEWIWEKSRPTGHMNAKKQPLRAHENILVFYKEQPPYNPIMETGEKNHVNAKPRVKTHSDNHGQQYEMVERISNEKYPRSVQLFKTISPTHSLHPTQKPVALFEYLIKTYTNPDMLVLDNCAGSGTTAIAAHNTGRRWHCIERDPAYYLGAVQRILSECV